MDFKITYVKEKDYFLIQTTGDTCPDMIEASLKHTFNDPNWHPFVNILYDNRREKVKHLSTKDVEEISLKFVAHEDKLKQSKIGTVMTDDLSFGLGRMWEFFIGEMTELKTRVFRSVEEAKRWIEN